MEQQQGRRVTLVSSRKEIKELKQLLKERLEEAKKNKIITEMRLKDITPDSRAGTRAQWSAANVARIYSELTYIYEILDWIVAEVKKMTEEIQKFEQTLSSFEETFEGTKGTLEKYR